MGEDFDTEEEARQFAKLYYPYNKISINQNLFGKYIIIIEGKKK